MEKSYPLKSKFKELEHQLAENLVDGEKSIILEAFLKQLNSVLQEQPERTENERMFWDTVREVRARVSISFSSQPEIQKKFNDAYFQSVFKI